MDDNEESDTTQVSTNTHFGYDKNKCESFIQKYSYEMNYAYDNDSVGYINALKKIGQAEYADIIAQLSTIEDEWIKELEDISKIINYEELCQASGHHPDDPKFGIRLYLYWILEDAKSHKILNDENIKAYQTGYLDKQEEVSRLDGIISNRIGI